MNTTIKLNNTPLPPPTNNALPIVGDVPHLLKDTKGYLNKCWKEKGDIFTLNLGLTKVIMLCHPDYVQYVLRDNFRNYDKSGGFWKASRVITGEGLITSEAKVWLKRRRLMQPHFHRKRLEILSRTMVSAIDEGMSDWEKVADTEQPLEGSQAFSNITMRVMAKTMFATGLTESEIEEVSSSMSYVMDYMILGLVTFSLPEWAPIPGVKKYIECREHIDNALNKVIDRCQAKGPDDPRDDLMSMLIDMLEGDADDRLTRKQFEDETRTLFLAGYETTSVALIWSMYHLARNPEIYKRLQAEIDEVLGDSEPTLEHLQSLEYTRMVGMEALRITPPGWWIPRTSVEEDEIGGYKIPAETPIICLNLATHHHPDIWDNPEKFDPERFSPENVANRHRFAWTPFGAGQRQCIGKEMALMEMTLILARMMQKYDFHSQPGHQVKTQITTTLKPSNGLYMMIKRR